MKGIDPFSLIAGLVLVIGGLILMVISFFFPPILIYAIIALVLGIVILVTLKQQEYIEPIKNQGKRVKKG